MGSSTARNGRQTAFGKSRRHGSLIIEVVVSAALFATAVIALGRLSQTTSQLSIQADQRLSARLTAGNVLEHLRKSPVDAMEESVAKIEADATSSSGFDVSVSSNEFQVAGSDALHWVVEVQSKENQKPMRVVVQDWHIASETSEVAK